MPLALDEVKVTRISTFRGIVLLFLSLLPGLSQFSRKKFITGLLLLIPFIIVVSGISSILVAESTGFLFNYDSFVKVQFFVLLLFLLVIISLCETIYALTSRVTISSEPLLSFFATFLVLFSASAVFLSAWVSFPQASLLQKSFGPDLGSSEFFEDLIKETEFTGFSYPLLDQEPLSALEEGVGTESLPEEPPSQPEISDLSWAKGRINILLIGGDAGPGRYGLRADSLNVVSIDATNRSAVLIGIPRNLGKAPLPEGALRNKMPNGFTNIINALYGWGHANKTLVTKNLGKTKDPGATLLAASVSELTGLPITGWILVDMGGFIEVVDALGGVEVYVPKDTRAAGAVAASKHKVKRTFPQGWNKLNGTRALSYTRTRSQDSDYSRMQRQRCVLASLAAQKTPLDLIISWPNISKVLQKNTKTNLTPSQVESLIRLAGFPPKNIKMLSLTPPVVPSFSWKKDDIHALVKNAIDPPPDLSIGSDKSSSVKKSCKTIRK